MFIISTTSNSKLTRQQIEQNTKDFYRTAGGTRPDLRVVDNEDKLIISKDFKGSDFLFRNIVGPILIRREYGALQKLSGIKGIPQIIGKLDRFALLMDHVDGKSLDNLEPGVLTQDFYKELRLVIDDMHNCGVAHCDLRSRGNVMLGSDGKPYVVDFAACVFRGRGLNPFINWLFNQFVLADNNAILRIKKRLSPDLISQDDQDMLNIDLPFEKPARLIGGSIRKLTRKLLTKKQ